MARLLFSLISTLLLLCASPIYAQEVAANNKEPIEITADGTLEWHRNDKKFIATKNALAKQGEISIKGETLTALYRDDQNNDMEIYEMRAIDGVIIKNAKTTAYGELAVYELEKELAVMTGDNLKIVSPDQTLTAKDKFEYFVVKGELIAHGDAKIIRPKPKGGTDTLEAAKISALFVDNEKGERVLKNMEAHDDVIITTPTETITGAYGIYHAGTNKAELKGQVTIKRGPNILEGDHAEVDLNTNISTLFGSETGKQERVRGVFYPGSEERNKDEE